MWPLSQNQPKRTNITIKLRNLSKLSKIISVHITYWSNHCFSSILVTGTINSPCKVLAIWAKFFIHYIPMRIQKFTTRIAVTETISTSPYWLIALAQLIVISHIKNLNFVGLCPLDLLLRPAIFHKFISMHPCVQIDEILIWNVSIAYNSS